MMQRMEPTGAFARLAESDWRSVCLNLFPLSHPDDRFGSNVIVSEPRGRPHPKGYQRPNPNP